VETVWQGPELDALTTFAQTRRTTVFSVVAAAFTAVLAQYANCDDIAVGLPVAGRVREDTEDLVGLFFDTVVLRTDVSGDPSFAELVNRVQDGLLDVYEHQEVPFEQVVRELLPERQLGRTPVFQVWCEMDNTDQQELKLDGAEVHEIDVPTETAKFDLSLSLRHRPDRLDVSLGYRTALFTPETARGWQKSIRYVLEQAIGHADEPLSGLALLTPDEQRRAVDIGQGPKTAPAANVISRFEAQTAAHPDDAAVICGPVTLTYAELDRLAARVSRVLRDAGAGPETRVLVCLERSPELIAAFLGTWKAGAAYVPLEPAHPADRARFVLADTGARIILTQRKFADRFAAGDTKVICLDEDGWFTPDSHNAPAARVDPFSLAYVIYTSGSTGRPKGVLIEHGTLANFVQSCVDRYALHAAGGAALFSSVAFDAVVPNVLTPLVLGQPLHLLPPDLELSGLGAALAAAAPFTFLKVTPSHLQLLTDQLTKDQACGLTGVLVVGAEAFSARNLAAWRALDPDSTVLNEYGPTEATVANSLYTTRPSDTDAFGTGLLPIGTPIANTSMYVLDGRMRPVPSGVIGQIYIGGHCLARGYERAPVLTAERFVPDPFSTEPGARLYATGDLGRVLLDGNVDFLGRADDQLKIRGYRIEPGEVEAALAEHPDVTGVHVGVVSTGQRDELTAWPVLRPDATIRPGQLRAWLARRLPDYLVPVHYLAVDAIPLTAHGKIDVRRLPAPAAPETDSSRPPATPQERALAAIWRELLGREEIGADDNFFSLGGDSLTALRMVARAQVELREQNGLRSLFENPTLAEFAALYGRSRGGAGDQTARAGRSLVTLKTGADDGRRLFCVHPSGGSVHWFQSIAAVLRPEDALYGFQVLDVEPSATSASTASASARSATSAPVSVPVLTARYLDELRAVQPVGPYHLLGYSWSGVVALEMAARLWAVGERIGSLLLVEPALPDPYTLANLRSIIRLHRRCARLIDDLAQVVDSGGDFAALRAELEMLLEGSELFPDSAKELTTGGPIRVAGLLQEAFHAHRPMPYPGVVDLVVTEECREAGAQRPSAASGVSYKTYINSWRELAQGGLSVHDAGGHHLTVLNPEHVHTVAEVFYRRSRTRSTSASTPGAADEGQAHEGQG
jgi:amino acid adenylation domain-containing protein